MVSGQNHAKTFLPENMKYYKLGAEFVIEKNNYVIMYNKDVYSKMLNLFLTSQVDLEYLLDRYPLDKEVNWGEELSLGEQQRLGMARLFYHKPKFAILDECTSAVTTDMEERFCAKVRAMGTSCITISHRPALVAFHDIVLSLDGEGGWSVNYKRY